MRSTAWHQFRRAFDHYDHLCTNDQSELDHSARTEFGDGAERGRGSAVQIEIARAAFSDGNLLAFGATSAGTAGREIIYATIMQDKAEGGQQRGSMTSWT